MSTNITPTERASGCSPRRARATSRRSAARWTRGFDPGCDRRRRPHHPPDRQGRRARRRSSCSPASSRSATTHPPEERAGGQGHPRRRGERPRRRAGPAARRPSRPDRCPRRQLLGADGAAQGGVAKPATPACGCCSSAAPTFASATTATTPMRCTSRPKPPTSRSSTMLVEAGSDVVGEGDDHQLGVLGWATCFRARARGRGASICSRHGARLNLWSAIALDRADDVRGFIARDPSLLGARMSRNEHHRTPLHHAAAKNRPRMVRLLLDLGADPNATDATGATPLTTAAQEHADSSLVSMLLAAGAQLDFMRCAEPQALRRAEAMLQRRPIAHRSRRPRHDRAAPRGEQEERGRGAVADRARRRRQCQARHVGLQPHGPAHDRRERGDRHRPHAARRRRRSGHPRRQVRRDGARLGGVLRPDAIAELVRARGASK